MKEMAGLGRKWRNGSVMWRGNGEMTLSVAKAKSRKLIGSQ
jgi:hypothetical protein